MMEKQPIRVVVAVQDGVKRQKAMETMEYRQGYLDARAYYLTHFSSQQADYLDMYEFVKATVTNPEHTPEYSSGAIVAFMASMFRPQK